MVHATIQAKGQGLCHTYILLWVHLMDTDYIACIAVHKCFLEIVLQRPFTSGLCRTLRHTRYAGVRCVNFFERVFRKMFWTLLGCTVAKACASPNKFDLGPGDENS